MTEIPVWSFLIVGLIIFALIGCFYFIFVKKKKVLALVCAILAAIPTSVILYALMTPNQYTDESWYVDGGSLRYDPYQSRPIDLVSDFGLNKSIFSSINNDTFSLLIRGYSHAYGGYEYNINESGNGSLSINTSAPKDRAISINDNHLLISFQFIIKSENPEIANLVILEPDNRFNVTFTYNKAAGLGFNLPLGEEHQSKRVQCGTNSATINILEDVGDSSVKGSQTFHFRLLIGYSVG